jgi:predicted DNA binding protein
MGSVRVDRLRKERELDVKYPLDSEYGVYALLDELHHIREMRRNGDFDAAILLLDFFDSVKKAGLTERQKDALYFVYEQDMPQLIAGKIMGITQQAVSYHVMEAVRKIAEYNQKLIRRSNDAA